MLDYIKAVSRQSKIVYGSNNEHVNSEKVLLDALDENRIPAKVLTICGGADNFMSLLAHERVSSVTCVDMNPHQLALGHLKLALACSDIPAEEALEFLGMDQSLDNNSRRLEVYERILEPELPDEIATVLRRDLMYEIEHGVAQFGGEINSFRLVQRGFAEAGFPPDDLWDRKVNLQKFEQVCLSGVVTPEDVGKAAFLDDSLPETYRRMWAEVCIPRMWCAYNQAVADEKFEKTFTKDLMLRGKYDMDSLPEWLLSDVRTQLRNKRKQIVFANSAISDLQCEGDEKFDLISTSNIFDWISSDAGEVILTSVVDKLLAPNGCMLVRLAFSNASDLTQDVLNAKPYEKVRPEQLAEVDHSHFWFRNPAGFGILSRKKNDNNQHSHSLGSSSSS